MRRFQESVRLRWGWLGSSRRVLETFNCNESLSPSTVLSEPLLSSCSSCQVQESESFPFIIHDDDVWLSLFRGE